MPRRQPSVQLSFRLSQKTAELLDNLAATGPESRNALAERLLAEGARVEHHPLIRFQQGASGRRQPQVSGTRLYVHQVIATLRASGGDVDEAAAYLSVPPALVRAALEYYGEFADEVDADAAFAGRVEAEEHRRLKRQQRALG